MLKKLLMLNNIILRNFICAGSDDHSFFIWDKQTTNIVRILKGDESIVNCIQPHPNTSVLATSGIDPVVRIWTPKFPAEIDDQFSSKTKSLSSFLSDEEHVVSDMKRAVIHNQLKIQSNRHPIELLLLNLAQNQQGKEFALFVIFLKDNYSYFYIILRLG
jgi:WD and tetratricopeptide repeat-containing protein 1